MHLNTMRWGKVDVNNNDAEFLEALADEGLDVKVIAQPATSLDTNLLDF